MCKFINLHILSIFLVLLALRHDYLANKFSRIEHTVRKYPLFALRTPYKEKIFNHQSNINYSRLIDIDFEFKVNPAVCSDKQFLLIIVVSSAYHHFGARNTIRETWGRANDAVKVVFTVGIDNDYDYEYYDYIEDDPNVIKNLIQESDVNNDIIQGNFIDTYRNLSYKTMMGLKWVSYHCPTARYVMKTDDDIFINIAALVQFLTRQMSPWGAQNLLGCFVGVDKKPERDNRTKWYVSMKEYKYKHYPPYCPGVPALLSQDVLLKLLEKSQTVKYFYIEDIYVTGILAASAKIHLTDMSYLLFYQSDSSMLFKWGIKGVPPFIFGPINLSPKGMRNVWRLMPGVREISL